MEWVAYIAGYLLTAAATIAAAIITNKKTQALLAYRMDLLERKVEVHNHVVERVNTLEVDMQGTKALYDEKIKVANHRLDDLERAGR